MKKQFLKKMLFSTALCAVMPAMQAQQNHPSFNRYLGFLYDYEWANSYSTPFVGDFDNDGINDVILNGQKQDGIFGYQWQTRTIFAKGLGEQGKYAPDFEALWEHPDGDISYREVCDTIWLTDEDGEFILDENGNKQVESLVPKIDPDTGEPLKEEVVDPCNHYMGTKNGLPQTSITYGSQPLDFNNDGLVDMLLINSGGRGEPRGLYLVRNDGNGHFTVVKDAALATMNFDENPSMDNNGQQWFNEGAVFGSIVTGDYDKDGFTDLLIQGNTYNGRAVRLFRNVNGEHFEDAKVFHPLPFEEEINARGLYKEDPAVNENDPETGDPIEKPGHYYEKEPTMQAKPMSHGNVAFFDMNNDGWLDIVSMGYVDGREAGEMDNRAEEEPAGDEIRFYLNKTDGSFQDVTPQMIPLASSIVEEMKANNTDPNKVIEVHNDLRDVFAAWAGQLLGLYTVDFNQDGKQELILCGKERNGVKLMTSFVADTPDPEQGNQVVLREEPMPLVGMDQAVLRGFMFVDFNGDDVPDLYYRGYAARPSNVGDGTGSDWLRLGYISQGSAGVYEAVDLGYWGDNFFGGTTQNHEKDDQPFLTWYGDMDNDGKIDLCTGTYGHYNPAEDPTFDNGWKDQFIFNYNTTDYIPAAPSAPEYVEAEAKENGEVLVSWPLSYMANNPFGVAMSNVYIRNNETGETRMLVPANIETGKQLSVPMFGTYATSYDENTDMCYYLFTRLPKGTYTVGVQSVNYSYLGSEFTTEQVTVEDGWNNVGSVEKETPVEVSVEGDMVTVRMAGTSPVAIYNVSGAEVATGVANTPIAVNAKGVFLVKVNNETVKIVK